MALAFFLFWMILNGRWTRETALIGVAVTLAAMLFMWKTCDWSFKKEGRLYLVLPRVIGFVLTVIWEIVKANLNMCNIVYFGEAEAVTRILHTRLTTRLAKMALANAITMTPGTITLDIAEDQDGKTWYYIHWIDVATAEPEAAGEAIKGRLERGLRRVWE